ncbi:PH domain-containing protein [Microlunatus sp. GCM10028923]|uniref:PH domain-containing protein n=1 Tax=Microlunatus sp. GCM10028923 TaxID=3273400 RepID=UPI003620C0EF
MADLREPSTTTEGPRPPREAVDPRCRQWWLTQWLVAIVIIVVPLVVLGVLIPPARLWLLLPAVIIAVAGLVAALLQPRLSYRIHRWEVTDDAVYSRTGWLWQEWRAAPLSRVQTVDLVRGPLQQRFGLATVTVTTASAKGAVKLEALDADQADELVQRLTVLTEAGSEGRTDRDAT